jgi:hypothetical protein
MRVAALVSESDFNYFPASHSRSIERVVLRRLFRLRTFHLAASWARAATHCRRGFSVCVLGLNQGFPLDHNCDRSVC